MLCSGKLILRMYLATRYAILRSCIMFLSFFPRYGLLFTAMYEIPATKINAKIRRAMTFIIFRRNFKDVVINSLSSAFFCDQS